MVLNYRSAGVADGTGLDRYGLSFFINMAPLKWFTVSAMIKGNRLQRQRNKNVRDRLAETGYIPDLSNPLPPNKDGYGEVYLKYFDGTIDDNKSNAVQGYVSAAANFRNLQLSTRVAFDYNEGIRDVFWPSTLMENNNYLSNYFGYNQRFLVDNSASYTLNLSSKSKFVFEAGQSITKDRYKYDYIYGYNTPNDYIKIFSIDLSKIAQGISPYSGISPYMFRFTDKEGFVLSSVYGKIGYSAMNNALKLSALVRNDGSSAYPASNRWLPSSVFSASYDFKKQILSNFNAFSTLSLNASYGKFGKLLDDDRFAAGPQYVVDLGWSSETNMGSYRGMAGLSRPYTTGWVGYDVPWAYSNKLDIGLNTGWWDNRVLISVDYYNNDDKNQLLAMPAFASSGYTSMYESGMWVNNKGFDATLSVQILRSEQGLNWSLNANVNQNKNVLKALPGGAHEVVIGSNKLEVGHSVDSYWLYENEGVYNSTSDIPVGATTGKLLNFNGIDFSAGDAKWNDENNDGVINDKDKVLKGHYMPTVSGGFGSSLSYKGLSLEFQFYYALGRQVLNQLASSRFDFINSEANNDINSVKEITFWQKPFDPSDYPMYNPWSSVDPYRVDQDLFLQNASFLKLRNLSIGYDISKIGALKRAGFKSSQIYVSATNLFTITPFKNGDPELSLYNGVYNGYGMTIPKCYTIGIKLNL
ncbi:SusC/RagA family TonB-linked outer membrane protein [Arachidicoccus sp.]|uniref:SusC/RagA family TonB-linked outer membrane protein n=1 Tax=Arachidicoccus sp. TaxID=1872624 RepID=UPI003D1A106E